MTAAATAVTSGGTAATAAGTAVTAAATATTAVAAAEDLRDVLVDVAADEGGKRERAVVHSRQVLDLADRPRVHGESPDDAGVAAAESVVADPRDVLAAPPRAAAVTGPVLVAAHPLGVVRAVALGAGGAGLGVLLEEGLEASWARHASVGAQLQRELPELGFRLFAEERRLPQLTSVWLPDGVDDAKVRGELLTRFDIEVGGGLGALAGKGWRIGLMGHGAREQSVTSLLGALRELL